MVPNPALQTDDRSCLWLIDGHGQTQTAAILRRPLRRIVLVCALALAALALGLGHAPSVEAAAGSGIITGKVTNTSVLPIEGVEVCASEKFSEDSLGLLGIFGACATTNAAGEYTLSGLPRGEYTVEFSSPAESELDYVRQYYNDRSSLSEAGLVAVSEGVTTGEIDAIMEEGGRVAGRVTSAATGAPLDGIFACVLPPSEDREEDPESIGCAQTNAGGEYTVSGLPGGRYEVGFTAVLGPDSNYVTEYYQGKPSLSEANVVVVKVGETTGGIDAALEEGARISGTVTNAANGAGLGEATVCALNVSSSNTIAGCEITEANGTYTLQALPSGQYKVEFFAAKPYLRQYYNDQYTLAEAQVLSLTVGTLTMGINAAMELGPASAPKGVTAPGISGTASVGSTLSCTNGTWSASPAPHFSYAWLRDGTAIAGTNTSSYLIQGADEGHTIACAVTATNVLGKATVTSPGLAIAIAPPPPPSQPIPSASIVATKVHVSGKSISVRVQCSGAPCRGTIELTLQVAVKHRKGRKTVVHEQTLVLAKGSFSLAAGKSDVLALRLTAAGKTKLAHAKHHPLASRFILSVRGGRTTTKSVLAS
jgi:hypothetical protein